MDSYESIPLPSMISVVGTGEFGRAMTMRLHESGNDVVVGSRYPSRRKEVPPDDILAKVKVTTLGECVAASNIIVIAIRPENYDILKPVDHLLDGKVLIDVSNSLKVEGISKSGIQSNAQKLASLYPRAHVVKAFNTVSAYALMMTYSSRAIYVCGDNPSARAVVMQMAGRMGFTAFDSGKLASATRVEEANRRLLLGWGWPSLITLLIFLIWTTYTLCNFYIIRWNPWTWERVPTNIMNKVCAVTSITLMALCFLPGSIAAFRQLATGTKHKRFHKSLDLWLKMRKQFGLYALLFGAIHMVMSTILIAPAYFGKWWFHTNRATIPANLTEDIRIHIDSRMNWVGETCTLLGVLSMFTMGILGLTSINSIADTLNWKEWRCLQSYMGQVCLIFSTAHVTVKGVSWWVDESYDRILPSLAFLSSLLPWFTLALRLVLLMPGISGRVDKIRRGWESKHADDVEVVVHVAEGSNGHATQGNNGHAPHVKAGSHGHVSTHMVERSNGDIPGGVTHNSSGMSGHVMKVENGQVSNKLGVNDEGQLNLAFKNESYDINESNSL